MKRSPKIRSNGFLTRDPKMLIFFEVENWFQIWRVFAVIEYSDFLYFFSISCSLSISISSSMSISLSFFNSMSSLFLCLFLCLFQPLFLFLFSFLCLSLFLCLFLCLFISLLLVYFTLLSISICKQLTISIIIIIIPLYSLKNLKLSCPILYVWATKTDQFIFAFVVLLTLYRFICL